MVENCPKCGFKLERVFKFCPNCSFDLKSFSSGVPNSETTAAIILCANCGTENDLGNKICSDCGAPLKGEKVEKIVNLAEPNLPSTVIPEKNGKNISAGKPVTNRKQSKGSNVNIKPPQKNAPKKFAFNISNIITIFGVGILLVFLILYLSGVFDHKAITSQDQELQTINASPDLSRLQEIKKLEEQIKSSPDNASLVLHLAQLQQDSKLLDPAVQNYKKYLAVSPKDADAHVDLGICYYDLGSYADAIKEMEAALKYDPKHQKACLNLGIVNLQAGNKAKSAEWLKKAVEIDPSSETGRQAQELLNSHK